MIIIGIDCATAENKTGLAVGSLENGQLVVHDVRLGTKNRPSLDIILAWLQSDAPAILAFDAPLGWPRRLADELHQHTAGKPIQSEPNDLFYRRTDLTMWREIQKKPLEVGADRIARTARVALNLLGDLRLKKSLAIPLAWEMGTISETCAIEVYPAGTLASRNLQTLPKKRPESANQRVKLINALGIKLRNKEQLDTIRAEPDAFDAVICILAAVDFLQGNCIPIPKEELALAKKEGWIWVIKPIQ